MTAAFITEAVDSQESVQSWKMPEIRQGTCVTYYDSTLAEQRKVVGYVVKLNKTGRTVTVHVPSTGQVMEQVRHFNDPKLKIAPEFRENGAWDYTDDWKQTQQRIADLEQTVHRLNEMLQVPTARQARAKTAE